jgi:acyl transferase domain-containing protein
MGLQFPGAQGSEEAFWELVRSAQTAIREVPKERWVISQERALGQGDELVDQLRSLRAGVLDDEPWPQDLRAHLEKLGEWDWLNRADILYKTSLIALWRALANAGLKEGLGPRCGLTFGNIVLPTDGASRLSEAIIGPAIAAELGLDKEDWPEVETRDRAAPGLPATLLARVIGAEGGARTLDAACASSLYALKFAADELRARRADLMIAGGVSRASSLYTQMGFSQLRALSRQGRCAPFEAGGDGLVVGEGAGFFVLRRLEDAIARGDRIRAVLRGFGLSNDRAGSLLAPRLRRPASRHARGLR